MRIRLVFALLLLINTGLIATANNASFTNVIPCPANIVYKGSGFEINKNTKIVADKDNIRNGELLAGYIKDVTGLSLKQSDKCKNNRIILKIDSEIKNPEGYRLIADKNGCVIKGKTPAGVFYGIKTLSKSIIPGIKDKVYIPGVVIEDEPRFKYRGTMLDVSRHFFDAEHVKRFIDILAMHNVNIFHWHLADDQGWRIEIKSRPLLTEKASMRPETVIGHNTPEYDGTPHGGFYTQEEIRDIVQYALDRHINIVPEIDIPGHAQATLTAYPSLGCTGGPYELWKIWGVSEEVLCAGNDSVYSYLEDVLGEVADLFPGEVIHIGGDECPKRRWQECPKCQAKIKELGIEGKPGRTAEQLLQSHVMEFAQNFLKSKGKRVIGWDEILEGGIGGDAMVMSWRGEQGGIDAANQGLDVVMTPTTYMYFDYYQTSDIENEPDANGGYVPLERVYSYNPVPAELSADKAEHIKGLQGSLWTAYVPDFNIVEYMLLPRLAALSEVQWCKSGNRDYERFVSALPVLMSHYNNYGYNFSKRVFDVSANYMSESDKVKVELSAINNAPVFYTLDGSDPDEKSLRYQKPIELAESFVLKAVAYHKGFGKSITYKDTVNIHKGCFKNIELLTEPDPKWAADGAHTLNDALMGNASRESGRWIGFKENDLVAVFDLKEKQDIAKVEVATCMVKNEWTFHARRIKVEISDDGVSYRPVASEEYPHITWDQLDGVRNHKLEFEKVPTRFVKVTVEPDREPEGHHIHGGGSVFVDEIVLK